MAKLHQHVKKQLDDLRKATVKVAEVDYELLSDAFDILTKPAKRALLKNNIHTPKDLARFTLETVANFQGISPEALDAMMTILQKQRLKFKSEK